MDSITHALYRAVATEQQAQLSIVPVGGSERFAGLKPIGTRRTVHEAYLDADPEDLHITLRGNTPELMGFMMELLSAGHRVPPTVYSDGVDVIMSDTDIHVYGSDAKGVTWCAQLGRAPQHSTRRTEWSII